MQKTLMVLVLLLSGILFAQQEARLLRFPAIHGEKIVFTYAGDLYTVSSNGGTARRITSNDGFEMFPKFSPDGKYIAFTGQYDGNTEVYLIPSEGGVPKRLTYTATLDRDDVSDRMGPNNIVMDWKDNNTILYRSRWKAHNSWKGMLYLVNKDGGMSEELPLPRGGFGTFTDDGETLVYNRIFREFRTWKRYRGGQADDVWTYNLKTKQTERLFENAAQDIFPMVKGDKVYFASDRDLTMNLFVFDMKTKEIKKLTDFNEFDVKFPSIGNNAIVFENGGYIYKLDLTTEKVEKVSIVLQEDLDWGRGSLTDVKNQVNNFEISPDGNRALFGARGEIFTVPAKNGPTRNITNSQGVHERGGIWSPDGKHIAFISDETGEDEVYIINQDGSGDRVKLTNGMDVYIYGLLKWSPDSKKIAFFAQDYKLYFVDIESKNVTTVDKGDVSQISQFSWSPDNNWIAYTKAEIEGMSKIYIYSLASGKTQPVTDGWSSANNPCFSPDGKYLYYVADRTFNPTYGWTEWNHIYQDLSKLYLITLKNDTPSPFEPQSDEVEIKTEEIKDADSKKSDEKKSESKDVVIDFDGILNRSVEIPVKNAFYFNLSAEGNKVFYMRNGTRDERPKLLSYDLKEREETELGEINGYEISTNGKKMLVGMSGQYAIIPLPSSPIKPKEFLNLSDLKVVIDRKAEWKQIYAESWRQMRDFFYANNMHGYDWEKIKKRYEPLVDYVSHRADLSYLIGEMIGELNAGHAYVGGGDMPKPQRVKLGLLGADLKQDPSGFVQITKILKGQNWDKAFRSPLTEVGVNVSEGEFIVAVDGVPVNEVKDFYSLMVNKANKQVTLSVNSKASKDGVRNVVVVPLDDEHNLRYFNMVETNLQKVSDATNGKVGYIHIPDMGANGLNWFVKYYYPQLRKDALIIDDRGNGGGNVSPHILERLSRKIVMMNYRRNSTFSANPGGMHVGPKVVLLDEFSASDGDIFPYRFKANGLGKLVGKRSWGGVVGISGSLPFTDGGTLNKPEFGPYNVEGTEWIMEGYGVDPDIIVDNDPALEYEGVDQQLNKAIELMLEELRINPSKLNPPPPFPNKTK